MKKYVIVRGDKDINISLVDSHEVEAFASDEVKIKVTHSGLGFIDALQASGSMGDMEGHSPGLEVEGYITALGDEVEGLSIGDRVAALCFGSGLSDTVVTKADFVVRIHDDFPRGLGAVSIVNTLTAKESLELAGKIGSFDNILIHGGVGGLGTQFLQIAKIMGAKKIDGVVGTVEKGEIAKGLGYDDVYFRSSLGEVPHDFYDVVVDSVGDAATSASFDNLKSGGRVIKLGNSSGKGATQFNSLRFWFENKSVIGFNVGLWMLRDLKKAHEGIEWCVDRVGDGSIVVPHKIEPISMIENSLVELLSGNTIGKIILEW